MRFRAPLLVLLLCLLPSTAFHGPEEKIAFVYLALGASDAAGVGATPQTEGYVYLIERELERRLPNVILMNLGVPGAGVALIEEEARVADQQRTQADLVTLWAGANDLIQGADVRRFQEEFRIILVVLRRISKIIAVANLPDLTMLPHFRANPNPDVTADRVAAFNRAIELETLAAKATLVNLFAVPLRAEWIFGGDGLHPDNDGHRIIADEFLRALGPALDHG
ncbi:MAG TPA: SGNH/GDSL hydrolase family protein [Nitrospira sp.]|nr:SGNH/GDSL hydrolase family protein [Nitrospira sp.]